jgi:hypothetical protein
MISVIFLMVGMLVGAGGTYLAMEKVRRERGRIPSLERVRWERTAIQVMTAAHKEMRRHYPTHELVAGCPFLDLVHARGAASEAVRTHCASWTVGIVMIDRRSEATSRIILWNEDAHRDEKTWILRRAGYKVTVMPRDVDTDALMEAMAA